MKRRSGIIVEVNISTESFDFDAWARRYVELVLEVDARQQRQQREAA